jgi:hypothetical protein
LGLQRKKLIDSAAPRRYLVMTAVVMRDAALEVPAMPHPCPPCRVLAHSGPARGRHALLHGIVLAVLVVAPVEAAEPAADPLASYSGSIKPLFAERCFSCHGGLKQEAGLRLDTVSQMLAGGDSGGAVVKGDADASLLLARVSDPEPASRMPPEGEGEPLSAAQLATLRDWIKAGCPAPPDEKPEADPRDHWAFQPRTRPAVPAVQRAAGIRNPIDAFLEAARERGGVVAQPEAPRHVLVRRLFIDLVGLPPQPDELAAIMADTSPDWYEQLVDRLLADPRHGERWARHWMDVWRYADWWGLGDDHRYSQKHMWHFRDWIVESLNADIGYDEMVRLMLAADELHPDDPAKLRATGFVGRNWFKWNRTAWLDDTVEHVGKGLLGLTMNCSKCHAHKYDPIQQEDYYRFRAFFEPIETRLDVVPGEGDFEKNGIPRVFDAHLERPTYLFIRGDDTKPDTSKEIAPGVPEVIAFREIEVQPVPLPKTAYEPERRPWVIDAHVATAARALAEAEARQAREPSAAHEQSVAAARAPSQGPEDPLRAAAAAAAKAAVKAEKDAGVATAWAGVAAVSAKLAKAAAEKKDAAALQAIEKELATAREKVGDAEKAAAEPGDSFTPLQGAKWTATRFKMSTADDPTVPFPATSTGRRTALAKWITDPRNPLAARVAVNHIWLRHMGRPLVTTVFDFGRKSNAPIHPALLDWLASELVDGPAGGHGWSMKHLHRLIVTSAAYRMTSSSAGADAAMKADPDNLLLWRRDAIRLESQVVRDALLAVSGRLDPTRGGPPVPESEQPQSRRRSLYLRHSEIGRNPFLDAFDDAAVGQCYQRDQSIVPQQSLAMTNSALAQEEAEAIARRLGAGVAAGDDAAFVEVAFRAIVGRPADAFERAACLRTAAAIREVPGLAAAGDGPEPARVQTVLALLNHNDFVTLR